LAEPARTDVLIAGGGFQGLSLAVALKQALGARFNVVLADPALGRDPAQDLRASAIAAAARRLLQVLGVWDAVAAHAEPIRDMTITDSRVSDVMRPVFLNFGGEIEEGEPFAHMVENRFIVGALLAHAREQGVDLRATSVNAFEAQAGGVSVSLADGASCTANLLVAADGANSRIREQAGIVTVGWSYPQSAIVTTVRHEREHGGRAQEHFLPAGPFATLPLTDRRASIVWTERTAEAHRIVALSDPEFHGELERRFGLELGDIEVVGARAVYPLQLLVARTFIGERLALIGDAAHVIHPIAGQGLNIGLRDVAALAEEVVEAARLGLDIGSSAVLDGYQQRRRFDTAAMGVATDALNRLFSNDSDLLRLARDVGLGIVDRIPVLKEFFIREAAGLTGDVPRLLRGEAL
jgi:2-octaprenyl-6-methoxyphenol hydroxylase